VLGAITTPVVAIGEHWISGAAFDRLDDFFRSNGASAAAPARDQPIGQAVGDVFAADGATVILDERQLGERLDGLLAKAVRYTAALSDDLLPVPLPERGKEGRTVRGLTWHIGQVAQDPLRAAVGVAIVKPMHEYDPPPELDTAAGLAARIAGIRADLAELLAPGTTLPTGVVEYFHGPYSFHGLLERTTWHVATHLRQLAWILVESGIDRDACLTPEETAALPMPIVVWK
jgi:hypothetical protein